MIGITGGIASGKSTVVAMIKEAGYQVIDADQVVHQLQEKGGRLYEALKQAFGNEILKEDGELNRKSCQKWFFQIRLTWQPHPLFKIKSSKKS